MRQPVRLVASLLWALLLGACRPARPADESAIGPILIAEARRRPLLQPDDLYKLVYHAALGGAHMGMDSAMAMVWLEREMTGLGPGSPEALVDTLAPGGAVVRVNLGPYRAGGLPNGALASAFAMSSRDFTGSRERLAAYWREAERLAADGRLPFPAEALRAIWARATAAGFPAPEHSEAYIEAYRPAYRVVTRAQCRLHGWCT